MEFKTRISYKVVSSLVMALVLVAFELFNGGNITDSWNVIFIIIAVFLVIRLMLYGKYIYLYLSKKSALVIAENYIYDAVKDVKYYQNEIVTLYDDNGNLYLKLIDQNHSTQGDYDNSTLFEVDLDLIDIDYNKLSEIIGNFGKKPQTSDGAIDEISDLSYQFKWGSKTIWNLIWLVVMAAGNVLSIVLNKDYFLIFILLFLFAVILPQTIKFFYFWISKKPVFTANRSFIYDHFNNIKYYWVDINELVVANEYMAVKLYHPENYLDNVKNPFRRVIRKLMYNLFHINPRYGINMDIIDVPAEENQNFLNNLDTFSATAVS